MSPTTRIRALRRLASPSGVAAVVLAVAAGTFLATYHFEHVVGVLPFALLLCPLLHCFLHGGHAGHGSSKPSGDGR